MHVVITGASSGIGEALAREYLKRGASWWLAAHRAAWRLVRAPRRRRLGFRRLALCALMDVVLAVFSLFGVAMLVSPWLGI